MTMSMGNRMVLVMTLCIGALGGLVGVSYATMASARRAASVAAEDVGRCSELAARIKQLRDRPTLAGAAQLRVDDLAGLVERAAATAGIQLQSVVRISPESGRRVGDSVYVEHPTQLQLANVTLRQLVDCLYALVGETPALGVRSIRIVAPRDSDENGDRWTAEVSVSYLVYAPRDKNGASNTTAGGVL